LCSSGFIRTRCLCCSAYICHIRLCCPIFIWAIILRCPAFIWVRRLCCPTSIWGSNTVFHSYIMSKLTINNATMTWSHCSKDIYINRNLHKQNNSNAIKTTNRSVHLTYMCIFLGSFIKTLYYLELYLIDQYHFMNRSILMYIQYMFKCW
jgi:hypothetical protein